MDHQLTQRPPTLRFGVTALLLWVLLTAGAAQADPTLTVSETVVQAGDAILITIEGFEPGGYDGTILIDGIPQQDIEIYPGGSRTFLWVLPSDLSVGGHDLEICAFCDQGDLEERTNTVRLRVISGDLGDDEFNLQVWGMEVTQGVRGDVPTRLPPDGGLDLPDEDITHVANRRTVVRVYPWVEGGANFSSQINVRAELWYSRDGTTHGPFLATAPYGIQIIAGATMEDLRQDMARTWNFVLPPEAMALANTETSGSMDLTVVVNPIGTYHREECVGCESDNSMTLPGNTFRHVGRSNQYALKLRPHLVAAEVEEEDESTTIVPRTTLPRMVATVRSLFGLLPVADGNRGVRLMPWRNVDWEGTRAGWNPDQDDDLIETYLPGGVLRGEAPPNDFYAFMYSGLTNCGGHSFVNTPFLRTPTCPGPPYVPAHELNHAIGAAHAGYLHNEVNHGGYDSGYPGFHGQVESDTWGMNVSTLQLHPPRNLVDDSEAHDFMSYGGTDVWVSRYTWDLTAENLGTPEIDPGKAAGVLPSDQSDKSDVLAHVAFRGRFDSDGSLDLAPFFGSYAPEQDQGSGEYELEFTDDLGSVLSVAHPQVQVVQDLTAGSYPPLFAEAIALPIGWSEMTLRENGTVIDSWIRGPNPPQVTLTSPVPGFEWPNTGDVTLAWDANDPDGGPLYSRVLAQHAASGEVFTLAAGLTSESFVLDRATLPGGGDWNLQVEVSDGLDRASSSIVSGSMDPVPPQAMIVAPADGEVHVAGSRIPAVGMVADIQGDIADGNVQWYLDGDWIGTGTALDLPPQQPGSHELQLVVYNTHQLEGSTAVQFDVVAELQPPTQVLPVDGATQVARPVQLDWAVVPGAVSYRVQVSYSPDFTGDVGEAGNLTQTDLNFEPPAGTQPIYWRVMAEHGSAPSAWSPTWSFSPAPVSSSVEDQPPATVLDLSVYPNPFNPATTIAFNLPQPGAVTIEVFNLNGRRVRVVSQGDYAAGQHSVRWNGRDESGLGVGSGVYLVRLVTPQGVRSQRVILLK